MRKFLASERNYGVASRFLLVLFVVLFVAAEAFKFSHGDEFWAVTDAVLAVFIAVACFFTSRVVAPVEKSVPERGRNLSLQLVICAIVFLATFLAGLHKVLPWVPSWFEIPLYSVAVNSVLNLFLTQFPYAYALGIVNVLVYCLPVIAILVALGVPLSSLGFRRFFPGSGAAAAIWLVVPIVLFIVGLCIGRASLGSVVSYVAWNFLQDGFSEEFLWRGAIFGRLRVIMRPAYALFLQSSLFALWHLRPDIKGYHGDLLAAVCDMIASQMLFGLGVGYLTLRTGNIVIGSMFHTLFDALGVFVQ